MALPGFAKFFRKFAAEELEHAQALMHYQNERGGRIVLQDIKKPAKDEWGSGLEAMQGALELEKAMNQSLLDLHKLADSHGDFNVSWLLLFTSLPSLFSSSYEGGPATCAYWSARNPRRTTCNGGQEPADVN